MRPIPSQLKDPIYLTGLVLAAVSSLLLFLPTPLASSERTPLDGLFFCHYFITATYFVLLLAKGKFRHGRQGLHHLILFFILFFISAYSLNRGITVFQRPVGWFVFLQAVVCLNLLAFIFFQQLPQWARYLLCTLAGAGLAVFIYLALYLVPVYPMSLMAFLFLGISLHSFVPLLFCIYIFVLLRRTARDNARYWQPFFAGLALPVIAAAAYAVCWNQQLKTINTAFRYASITANNQLPPWIRVAQQTPHNDFSEKILQTELVYSAALEEPFDLFRISRLNFEKKYHDPLVMISTFFCGPVHVPIEDRTRILESLFDARHQTQERLWSGNNLVTEQVSSTMQWWPNLRMAYSEMELTIGNTGRNSRPRQEEAIYTFHLPEGGVVTSLSLWINGKEEKGILTTKSKADSAYKTIVGGERRDPSVVHWQEGNTVSVRVFPILEGESRKFKIGITTPLIADGKKLRFDNIYFEGPSFSNATETVSIAVENPLTGLDLPQGFTISQNRLHKTGAYAPDWSIAFDAPPLAPASFRFDSARYSIVPAGRETESFDPAQVYLDINAAWSQEEYEAVYQLVKNKEVYVSDGGEQLTRLTESNREELFPVLTANRFSLFPFHKIASPATALVISKSNGASPTIKELRNSAFLEQTNHYFGGDTTIRLFHIGRELSPYLKSLKEFRLLQYDHGDLAALQDLLTHHRFTRTTETAEAITIHHAGISIRKEADSIAGNSVGNAPDHLMRLFAYNHILQQTGRSLLQEAKTEETVIDEAAKAYVVTPFSSLVVLETQRDYERFNIEASKNSLHNASIHSNGAVPEPHEWALIALVLLLCGVVRFRPNLLSIRKK